MKKYISSIVLGIILALISFSLLQDSKETNNDFSYYDNIGFDFIIPKPWYSQIPEIKEKKFVTDITPYYMTGKKLVYNGKTLQTDIYLFENTSDLEISPFSKKLMLEGTPLSSGTIIIDERVCKSLNISVNDTVQISFGNDSISFFVCGITQQNHFATRPTASVLFTEKVKSDIEQTVENLAYSGAYVKVSDFSTAEKYFNKDYRALGRVGERSWYKNDKTYNYMKESIGKAEVAKEIINIAQIRANTKSVYVENKRLRNMNLFFSVLIVFFIPILFWLLFILSTSKSYRSDIKNGKTIKNLLGEFVFSEALVTIVFFTVIILLRKSLQISKISLLCLFFSNIAGTIVLIKITNKIIYRKCKSKKTIDESVDENTISQEKTIIISEETNSEE